MTMIETIVDHAYYLNGWERERWRMASLVLRFDVPSNDRDLLTEYRYNLRTDQVSIWTAVTTQHLDRNYRFYRAKHDWIQFNFPELKDVKYSEINIMGYEILETSTTVKNRFQRELSMIAADSLPKIGIMDGKAGEQEKKFFASIQDIK